MGQYCFARCRLSALSSVTLPECGPAGHRRSGAWAVSRPTLHCELVRLRPVKATPCLNMYNFLLVTSRCVSLVYQFILRTLYALCFIFHLYFIPIVRCNSVRMSY